MDVVRYGMVWYTGTMGGEIYSSARKGLAISSKPSRGLRRVIVGPRRTTRPSERLLGFEAASQNKRGPWMQRPGQLTRNVLLDVVQHEVEKLIEPLEDADNFWG
jgi:hypothetical protein